MLSRILVEGYKSVDRIEMELGEFTLLSGVNSSGKSTIIQALLYIVQEQKRVRQGNKNDQYIEMGKFADIKNHVKGAKAVIFELDMEENGGFHTSRIKISAEEGITTTILETPSEKKRPDYTETHSLVYLPVDRIGVEKAYDLHTEASKDIGSHGEYTYSFLAMYGQEPIPEPMFVYETGEVGMSLNNQVNYWLEYLMGFHVQTDIVSDVDQVVVTYSNAQNNRYYRAKNVGTGVTYIAVLVIAALTCKSGDTLVVENPEIHLHPRAQSRFVEFLAYLSARGLQVILETHSDHIYNGVRKCVKKKTLSKDETAVYFLELDESMQTQVHRIKLNEQGAEENHPYGLFDQFDDDLDELLGM